MSLPKFLAESFLHIPPPLLGKKTVPKFPPASPLPPFWSVSSAMQIKNALRTRCNSPSALARNDNSQGSSGRQDGGREEPSPASLHETIKLSHRHPSPGSIPAPVVKSQRRPSPHLADPLSLCSWRSHPHPDPGKPWESSTQSWLPLFPSASPCSGAGRGRRRRGNVRFLN